MRRLLYPLVFALVLFLAGSAVTLGGDIPHGGGTVPGEGAQVWLPVVGKADRSETCNYSIHWDVIEPYVVKLGEPVTVAFSWKYDGGGYNDPWWWLQASDSLTPSLWWKHYLFVDYEHAGLDSASETFVIQPEDGPSQPGVYQWWLRADCTLNSSTVPVAGPPVSLIVIYE
ncbi:MAG: hypothetical protein D6790_21880 [Caldilineae bacterium]|nr:MAG: hypothetical protein D6790_21880 [Caldilineae bacterium]